MDSMMWQDILHFLWAFFGILIAYTWITLKWRGGEDPPPARQKLHQQNNLSNGESKTEDGEYDQCKSPNCVRCTTYASIKNKARKRLLLFIEKFPEAHINRVVRGVNDEKQQQPNIPAQKPNILHIPALEGCDWWTKEHFKQDVQLLKENFQVILSEFLTVSRDLQKGWLRNSTPSGEWDVFHLINQGMVKEENCEKCPETKLVLDKLKMLMGNNVFGNACFSVLKPGTLITKHYGPCNVRIRCHLGLEIPAGCKLTVNEESREWIEGDVILFDDSFLHSASNDGPDAEETPSRAVLMVDMWHPDLTEDERNALDFIYS